MSVDGGERILLDTTGAAKALSISERHFCSLERSGRIGVMPVRLGKCVRWSSDELRAWARAGCPSREAYLRQEGRE